MTTKKKKSRNSLDILVEGRSQGMEFDSHWKTQRKIKVKEIKRKISDQGDQAAQVKKDNQM